MNRSIAFLVACLPLAGGLAWSAEPSVDALSPFLDDGVAVVCRIRLKGLDAGRLVDRLIEDKKDAAEVSAKLSAWFGALRGAGARDMYILGDVMNPAPEVGSPSSVVVPLVEGADAEAIGKILCGGGDAPGPYSWPTCAVIHGAVFAGDDAALERARQRKTAARPELAAAMAAANGAVVALAVVPSADARRVIEELMPNLPKEVGGGPSTILTKGLKWAVLTLGDQPEPNIRLVVQASDPKAARELLMVGDKAIQLMRNAEAVTLFVPDFGKLADQLAPEVNQDRITVTLDARAAGLCAQALSKPWLEQASRERCVRNFMQIGRAMHNYLGEHGSFPPPYRSDAEGKPLLSWRVLILPYLEQNDLYKEFHLDEPWDSPHNKPLITRMPEVYVCPSPRGGKPEPGTTVYVTPRGPQTMFPGAVGLKIKEITDGTSNTIMTFEVPGDRAVIWTKPDDWEVPDDIDLKALLSRHLGGSNSGFADGSVRFLKQSISPDLLRKFLTSAGGEVIGFDED